MNTYVKRLLVLSVVVLGVAGAPGLAAAGSPQLLVSDAGSSRVEVRISNADPYAQADLYSRGNGTQYWTLYTNIGRTDGSGFLQASGNFGFGEFYVAVNGLQSSMVNVGLGCSYGCGNSSAVTFSQNNPSVQVGQTITVQIYGGGSNLTHHELSTFHQPPQSPGRGVVGHVTSFVKSPKNQLIIL